MKIKITKNTTPWKTKDMSCFIRRVTTYLEKMEDKRPNHAWPIEFEIVKGGYSGVTVLNAAEVRIRIPFDKLNKPKLAHLVYHELQHVIGYKDHSIIRRAWPSQKILEHHFGWCKDIPITKKEPKPKKVVNLREIRHRKAVNKLDEWKRKLKFAQTKVQKYKKKVGYYEKAFEKAAINGNKESNICL